MATRDIGVIRERPVYGGSLLGVVGLLLLVLSGGGHTPLAFGIAALTPGLLLLWRPPETGFGPGVRYSFLAFMACMLLAFVPQFYWPTADWRIAAGETYGIDLPALLTIQPRVSFEGCILLVSGFAWFTALANSRLNGAGLRWTLLAFASMAVLLASVSVYGNLNEMRYAMAEDSPIFSFFPNRNQTANFMTVAGVVSFGFALEGLRQKRSLHIVGFIASGLCLFALILGLSRAGMFLYFLGVSAILVIQYCKLRSGFYLKFGIPLVLLALVGALVSRERSFERLLGFLSTPADMFNEYRVQVFKDAWTMFLDAPLTGVGMGNFAAIFPQYRDASVSSMAVIHPESDLFWLLNEGGVLSLICFVAMLILLARLCFAKRSGRGASYRPVLLVGLVVFGLHSLVDVSAHRPGTAYLALFVAALMVPRDRKQLSCLNPVWWRTLGLGLSLIGFLWIGSYTFGWRIHSAALADQHGEQVDGYIKGQDYMRATSLLNRQLKQRPLDWKLYFQRAQLELADLGDRKAAAESFRAARFVEPIQAVVCLEEGFVWLPYDLSRAVGAWRESLFRVSTNRMDDFDKMVRAGRKNPLLLDRLSLLSELEPEYRIHFLTQLKTAKFEDELGRELEQNPDLSKYTDQQRSELLRHWINHADLVTAEAFLLKHESELSAPWQLWAELRKSQARFRDAVEIVRESVVVPVIPEVEFDESELALIERGFAVVPSDLSKGTGLLKYYLKVGDFEKALLVADSMAGLKDAPRFALYWKAEVLYQMEDYIESWYVFDAYMRH